MIVAIRRLFISGFGAWLGFIAIAFFCILPLRDKLRFGIDLVGGTYITLGVQGEKAVEAELASKMQLIAELLKKEAKIQSTLSIVKGTEIRLTFANEQDAQVAKKFLAEAIHAHKVPESMQFYDMVQDGSMLQLAMQEQEIKRIKEDAVDRNIRVLNTRLNGLGVADINIAKRGTDKIVVELPDVDDPQRAKAMIGKAAQLEFKIVERHGRNAEDLAYEYGDDIPADMEILPGKTPAHGHYLVKKYTNLNGSLLKEAEDKMAPDTNLPIVSIEFLPEGGDKFYAITSKNYKRKLAIVLDGVVIAAPMINEPVGARCSITGLDYEEARELAMLLKSGAFVAPVTFEEERQIGPTLGAESIRQGVTSCLVGLGLLFIFSIFFYSLSGLFAFIALLYNILLVLLGMVWLHATLTLPGIAGIVLTIGMAIDASILIYERIREELGHGAPVRQAVEVGFSNAMEVILDANITTFLVGIVLYKFGAGPIKGFAVTMMLGILATLITGLLFLRSFFRAYLEAVQVKKLKI